VELDNEVVLETERLQLSRLNPDADAAFMLAILNEPSFIQFVADRGVRTVEAARDYILNGAFASYAKNGFGLYRVALKATGEPIGVCGLILREGLDDPDIGYSFLPPYWGRGYATEAATAVLAQAREVFGLRRVVAIVSQDNERSINVIERIGMHYKRLFRLPNDAEDLKLFAIDWDKR
jgi:RimJ/RimL family protein N-acetyltransferase